MKSKVRWAILGAGKIARSFVNDFNAVENAELIAIAASDKARAELFAKEYGLQLAYSYNELYNSLNVDAVYIATTNNFHYEQTIQCLKHGKNVLCEKPITINDKQFSTIASLSKEKKLFLMEAMWTYFLPPVQKAKQWVEEGRIGNLKIIEANFGFPITKNPAGRLYNIELAGGALLDIGVYLISFATYFMSRKPTSISASSELTNTGIDERTGMIFEYGDATASLICSIVNIMVNKGMLYGEKGYIELPNFFKASTVLLFDDRHHLIDKYEDGRTTKGYNYEIQHATDAILQGKIESDIIPHSRSKEIQEIMTEVRRKIRLVYPGE